MCTLCNLLPMTRLLYRYTLFTSTERPRPFTPTAFTPVDKRDDSVTAVSSKSSCMYICRLHYSSRTSYLVRYRDVVCECSGFAIDAQRLTPHNVYATMSTATVWRRVARFSAKKRASCELANPRRAARHGGEFMNLSHKTKNQKIPGCKQKEFIRHVLSHIPTFCTDVRYRIQQ